MWYSSGNKDRSFLHYFYGILDQMVMYTNVTGHCIANQQGFIWRKTNHYEINVLQDFTY